MTIIVSIVGDTIQRQKTKMLQGRYSIPACSALRSYLQDTT